MYISLVYIIMLIQVRLLEVPWAGFATPLATFKDDYDEPSTPTRSAARRRRAWSDVHGALEHCTFVPVVNNVVQYTSKKNRRATGPCGTLVSNIPLSLLLPSVFHFPSPRSLARLFLAPRRVAIEFAAACSAIRKSDTSRAPCASRENNWARHGCSRSSQLAG